MRSNKRSREREEESHGNPESDSQLARMPEENEQQQQGSSSKRRRRSLGASSRRRSRKSSHAEHNRKSNDTTSNLVEQYRAILEARSENGNLEEYNKAHNVLVAAAGNVMMAAQLYWDDYFASQAGAALMEQDYKLPARHSDERSSDDEEDDDVDDHDIQDGYARLPHRRVRRSLDRAFGLAANDSAPGNGDNDDDENMSDLLPEVDAALEPDRHNINGNNNNNNNMVPGSVSVSDDEGASSGVWKLVDIVVARLEDGSRRRRANDDMERRIREAAAAVARKVSPKIESDGRRRKPASRHAAATEEEDIDYLSDSDWLQDDKEEGGAIDDPLESLWGKGSKPEGDTANANPPPPPPPQPEDNAEGNVVADEETEDRPELNEASGIPQTWLSASFSLAESGAGLSLKPPKAEDIEFFTWRQQQNPQHKRMPPPHHCKAITGILAIVNGLLLSGATIQGNEVNCTKAQIPFAQLSQEELKRQFEQRLTEALAALIFVAANASRKRKERALAKAKEEYKRQCNHADDESIDGPVLRDEQEMKFQKMKRRLNLIPACTWEDDPTASMPQALEGPSHRNVQVRSSLTNIQDIRLYVLSNIREFMAPGGVALLLETILRIHSAGVIARMMERVRKEEAKAVGSMVNRASLISCTCEARQKALLEKNPPRNIARNDTAKLLDTTPPGHECISKELISLLLTGRIESSWRGWSTNGLGIGVLSKKAGLVGWQLARPGQPVWVLQGDTCYSVLYLEKCAGADGKTVAKQNTPGAVLDFIHWNCWYGQRNKSSLRLTTSDGEWTPPEVSSTKKPRVWDGCRGPMEARNTVDLLMERFRDKNQDVVSAMEQQLIEAKEKEAPIWPEELAAAKAHPEDKHFYPTNHRMWRFDMGVVEKESYVEDGKPRANNWIPYHRLSARQKKIVELKLGPKICGILWTRWPDAKIDNFMPASEDPPIV
eukprot:scaffold4026_cov117-Cylindrotheca_fusiformis.AAC.15